MHPNARPAIGKRPVLEIQRRARALEQGLGDEKAQSQSARDIVPSWSAFWRLRRWVVTYGSPIRSMISGAKPGPSSMIVTLTSSSAPRGRHLDPLAGEVNGVLEKIAETVEDRGIAPAHRLGRIAGRKRNVDRDAEIAVRRNHLLDQRRKASSGQTDRRSIVR